METTPSKPRHSFARELFRFNNSSSGAGAGTAAAPSTSSIQRIGSADGYGRIQHRTPGQRAPIPMRKAKTQHSYPSNEHKGSSGSDSKRTTSTSSGSRLSALLSPQLWNSALPSISHARSAESKGADNRQQQKQSGRETPSFTAHASPSTSGVASPAPHTPAEAPQQHTLVSLNGSDLVELPPGTRVGKTARTKVKQHLQAQRLPQSVPLRVSDKASRRASLPVSPVAPAGAPTAFSPAATPPYPLPLPPGQKARTVLVGISPPPTAPHDGSLATFEHVRRHVLRAGEEAILHTVLPESQARRKVTSPQDLIELTAELEREDEQYLEMQSACMNFLTLLAVELETSDRFVKIHVTQAQPPDGGTAAQARAHSRSHSRSRSRTRSRPSSSAGFAGVMGRTASLGGLLSFGDAGKDERGRSRVCEKMKAREDEAIANELSRVAREYDVDLVVIGQPASAADEDPPSSRPHSRPQSRAQSRAASRTRGSNANEREEGSVPVKFDESRRGSRASKGSGSGSAGALARKSSILEEDLPQSEPTQLGGLLLTHAGPGSGSGPAGTTAPASAPDFTRSDSGYSSGSGAHAPPPPSALSSHWNFGADSFSAVAPSPGLAPAPFSAPLPGNLSYDVTQSPRTPSAPLSGEASPHQLQEVLVDDGADVTRVGQVLLLSNSARTRTSSTAIAELAAASQHQQQQQQHRSLPAEPHSAPLTQMRESTTLLGEGVAVGRRSSRVTIADEPADSPLRQRQRDRERERERERGQQGDASPQLGPDSTSAPSSQPSSRRGSAAPLRRLSNTGEIGPLGSPAANDGAAAPGEGSGLGSSAPVPMPVPAPPSSDGSSMTRLRSASGSGNSAGGGASGMSSSTSAGKRLSRLLEKAHFLPSASSSSPGTLSLSSAALNGLATELVRKAPVPVLVVDRHVLDAYR
ncbi:hypothetical protein OC834_002964 [Tilletia horrida]|nr:hypothetical protein OC834_002964 [Tilletia horrida]